MDTKKLALLVTRVSAIVLFGTLIGLRIYGIDLTATLFGGSWQSPLPHNRMAEVLQGITVSVVILFGSLLTAGIIALLVDRTPGDGKPTEQKSET